jgi:hypothetical protein
MPLSAYHEFIKKNMKGKKFDGKEGAAAEMRRLSKVWKSKGSKGGSVSSDSDDMPDEPPKLVKSKKVYKKCK